VLVTGTSEIALLESVRVGDGGCMGVQHDCPSLGKMSEFKMFINKNFEKIA
jgi:hypothetical protein